MTEDEKKNIIESAKASTMINFAVSNSSWFFPSLLFGNCSEELYYHTLCFMEQMKKKHNKTPKLIWRYVLIDEHGREEEVYKIITPYVKTKDEVYADADRCEKEGIQRQNTDLEGLIHVSKAINMRQDRTCDIYSRNFGMGYKIMKGDDYETLYNTINLHCDLDRHSNKRLFKEARTNSANSIKNLIFD